MHPRYHRNAIADLAHYPEPKSELIKQRVTPFSSCGDCNYASTGFVCYRCEEDCMKTRLEQIKEKKAYEKQLP